MSRTLDNIFWHALTGPHACYAEGSGAARRYAHGFSPILGFEDVERPDFAALQPYCERGEQFYTDGWAAAPPAGWRVLHESTMFKMIWDAPMPEHDDAPDAIPLRAEHAPLAQELAALTRPGPFGPRTIELGEYFGLFDGDRLIAMAGERTFADRLREVSGICTHPDVQGRGLARRLIGKLVRRQLQRGETPFLHVTRENTGARYLYARMGFREYKESVVRVVEPIG